MPSPVQLHHILPNDVYEAFRTRISTWTNGTFNQNAAYNLVPTSITPTGAENSQAPQQNGSHPWLNEAFRNALTDLQRRTDLSDAQKGQHFAALHSYFRAGLDFYSGNSQVDFQTFLTRTDPAALAHFGGLPTVAQMNDYFRQNHSYSDIIASDAFNNALNGTATNGSFGAINADTAVMPLTTRTINGSVVSFLDTAYARDHFGITVTDPVNGTFTADPTIGTTNVNGYHGTSSVNYQTALTDTMASFLTDTSSGVSFTEAQVTAGRFIDAMGDMFNRPGFEQAFKNGLLSGIGSTIGDLAELANALYEPFKQGITTGNWSNFGNVALELGIGTVLSGLAIAGLGGAISFAFGPVAGAAFAAGILAYGLWEGMNAFYNLAGKIWEDILQGDFWEHIWNPLIAFLRDPLTLDLDDDGIELISLANSTTHFDLDGNGFAERTGWVAADDGMLVRDGNRNGRVDSVAELFGSATQDGFAVLETYDLNHDGKIDARDAVFRDLKVWRDLNQDGVSQRGELFTLAQLGIRSISMATQEADTIKTIACNDNLWKMNEAA